MIILWKILKTILWIIFIVIAGALMIAAGRKVGECCKKDEKDTRSGMRTEKKDACCREI